MRAVFSRRVAAEALGSAFLLAAVVGSGIMAERLAGGNVAIALLCNTLPTGAMLVVLILIFGPVSGAHLNPAVSLSAALRGEMSWREAAFYSACQIAGAIAGVLLAHLMFELPAVQISLKARSGVWQALSEFVATFGLVLTIRGCAASNKPATPYAVGLYITAAYWFTASTSFANPAVTIARSLSDTFSGIAPRDLLSFVGAQMAGAAAGVTFASWLWRQNRSRGSLRPNAPPGRTSKNSGSD